MYSEQEDVRKYSELRAVTNRKALTKIDAMARWIDDAALEVVRRIKRANGGAIPRSLREWEQSCAQLGVYLVGIAKIPHLKALITEFVPDQWMIVFNLNSSAHIQQRYIAHELAEYVTLTQSWGIPTPDTHHNSGEVRHHIACRVERICFGETLDDLSKPFPQ